MTGIRPERPVVVVGGANLDLKARTGATPVARTSNPGTTFASPGGVGRNIAENLARLGTPVELVAPVGTDAAGTTLREQTAAAGVGTAHLADSETTGTYLAVLDDTGELVLAVSDMRATDTLTVEAVAGVPALGPGLLVLDGNLPAEVTTWLLDRAAEAGVAVVLDPVSVAKARVSVLALGGVRPVLVVTPNVAELAALVDAPEVDAGDTTGLVAQARDLLARDVHHVWVRRGGRGSLVVSSDEVVEIDAPATELVDVTGAGDAGTAGLVHALHRGADVMAAARFGQVVAALTCASDHTVRPDLATAVMAASSRDVGSSYDRESVVAQENPNP